MAKSFETTVEIKGAIGSSFTASFNEAADGLVDLKTQARAVQKELDRLGRDFRQGKLHQSQFTEETQKLARELKKLEDAQKRQLSVQQRFSAFQTSAGNVWNSTKSFASIATAGAATAGAFAFANSVNMAADFEAQMAKVAAKTEATKSEMQALNQSALSLGASSSLSASEVAVAMDSLGAKGMDAQEIIAAMPGMISAAEASGEDLALVSDIVTSAINAYGLSAEEASRIADVMSMSANKSAAGVADLGFSFKYAAPVAKTLGIELEELAAVTGLLVDKGLEGEQAGTALRMSLIRLSNPPKEAQKVLNKLNISAVDANDNFKSLAEISEEWNRATKDLTQSQKVQYAATVFGTEASTAMLSLFESGPDKIKEMTTALEQSGGAAEKAAKQMKDNYAGSREQMFGAIESAQIAFATPILPVAQDLFNGITATIENNMGNIENAGQAVADVIKEVTAPFAMTEPIKPVITPNMDPTDAKNAIIQYNKDLEKYELFSGMDFSEKVGYMLDETGKTIEGWLDGEGGEVVDRVFSELGTIAGKAWLTGFTTAAGGAVTALSEGNFAGALGMGMVANMMTGGLLLTGGLAGSKWLGGKLKGALSNKNGKASTNTKPYVGPLQSARDAQEARKANAAANSSKNNSGLAKFGKYGKYAGKAFLPLSILASVANIASSDNKSEAVGSAVGGVGGAVGGAALGATIGSIFPVIGTAAGGIIGGIAGGLGGDALGGWIGNKFGGGQKATASPPPTTNSAVANTPSVDTSAIQASINKIAADANKASTSMSLLTSYLGQASGMIYGSFYPLQEQTKVTTHNMGLLTSYAGQASGMIYGSFYPLQEQTKLVTHNMGLLVSYVGQASGWLATLQGIQPAGQGVIDALNNLTNRINNINLPNSTPRRLSYEE